MIPTMRAWSLSDLPAICGVMIAFGNFSQARKDKCNGAVIYGCGISIRRRPKRPIPARVPQLRRPNGALLDEKYTGALAMYFEEVPEVVWHRPEVGSDKNPILLRSEGQYFGVGNSFQLRFRGGKKIDSLAHACGSKPYRGAASE
jgi:hypothetical protein